ncbi:MAG: prepilin peptidase [Bacilli bacterium]
MGRGIIILMNIFISIIIFIMGLIFGSFFACAGLRIPKKISLIKPNSYCPKCNHELAWYMNIPLFSYIFLKGKCAYCNNKISKVYPIIELFTASSFLLFYLLYGCSYNFFISIILCSALSITLVSDFYYYYISDRVLVISSVLLIICNIIFNGIKLSIYNILYALIMLIIMILLKLLGNYLFKKESLGTGDIKLIFMASLPHNLYISLITLFVSSFLGLIYSLFCRDKKENIIPFGPFILIASLITLYFTKELLTFII